MQRNEEMSGLSEQGSNQAWKFEQNGINMVPEAERTGRPRDLFPIWFAANIGILGIVYGALIVAFGLNIFQSILTALVGAFSFMLVGYLSIAGRDGAAPMFTLSRAIFGIRGNFFPTLMSWINLLGWEAVTITTGTMSMMALLSSLGLAQSGTSAVMSMLLFAALVVLFGLLGQASLIKLQSFLTWVFGGLTLMVIALIIPQTDWQQLSSIPAGSWWTSFLPAVSIIMAGTGISWAITASDYSRYQRKEAKGSAIFWNVTLGGAIPLFVIMTAGILLSSAVPDLVSAGNPIEVIGASLPRWMTIPYLLTAVGGLIAQAVLSLYSAGLNLQNLGLRIKRTLSVVFDACVMISVATYVFFIEQDFMGPFQSFLILIGVCLASWEAIFMMDYILIRKKAGYPKELLYAEHQQPETKQYNGAALSCWLLGIMVGLLFTNSPFFNGPLAVGIFQDSSLGVLLSFFVSGLSYTIVALVSKKTSTEA